MPEPEASNVESFSSSAADVDSSSLIVGGKRRKRTMKRPRRKGKSGKARKSVKPRRSRKSGKRSSKRGASPWIAHVKKFGKDNKQSFREALSNPRCKAEYRKSR